jgi:hypothetical protein
MTADELLAAVKQLPPAERARFQRQVAALGGQDYAVGADPLEAADEETLLAQIREHSALPGPDQRHFNRLRRKRQAERLTKAEEKELQAFWQRVERMNVSRLRALNALARQRGTDVRTLLGELGLSADHVF